MYWQNIKGPRKFEGFRVNAKMTVTDNERARSTAVRKGIGQAFKGNKKIVQKSDRSTSVGVTKVAILVAGMHRSGTSATTRFLSILGCTLPKIVSGAALDNERGFWETPVIRDLNEQILASAGSAWDDWEAIDSRWYNSLVADRFREQAQTVLESEFGDSRLFVLKDPRICRLLPFWIEAVRSFGAEPLVVSPIRNPLDIAKSLEERNGIDPSIGLLMWLRHLLDAEVASRDLRRAYLRYEHLLFKPHKVADELSDTLGVVWPKHSTDTDMKTEEFLSPTLHHHQSDDASFLANPRLSNWLRSSFDIFDRWACGKVRKTDTANLNRIKLAFDKAMPAFGRAVSVGFKATRELGSAQERVVERDQRIEELSSELGSAQERVVERDQRIEELSSELGSAQERVVERDQRIEELSSELGSAQERVVERDQRIEELSSELGSAQERVVERDQRIEELSSELGSAQERLVERDQRIEELSSERGSAQERLVERDQRIEELSSELGSAQERLVERDQRIEELSSELGSAQERLVERDQRIEELSSELGSAQERLVERDQRIEELSSERGSAQERLVERDQRIEELSSELGSAQERLVERDQRIEELSSELGSAQERLVERDQRIEELSSELGSAQDTLVERDERITQLDAALYEIRTSTCWRLTLPIRYLGIHVKRAIRIIRYIFLVLWTPKAIKGILQRFRIVLRQEGVTGIGRRLHTVFMHETHSARTISSLDDRRKEFIPPGVNSEPDIFILSIIDWDFRFQRPQHVAKELAQSGKRVFYVEMMLEPDGPEIRKINKNLYRVRLSSKGIGLVQPYTTQMGEEQKLAWIEAFNSFCDAVEATSFKQIIIQHPFWWQMVRSISPEFRLIHDCMDNISGFSNTNSFILDLENDMIANCDMLIVSSQTLFDKFKGIKLPRLIRNAADIDHFSSQNIRDTFPFKQNTPSFEILRASAETPETGIIKVGYVGAIAEWFDAALVGDIALDEPNFLFHLCGEVTDKNVKNLLHGIDNVLMYGEIDYVDVPSFLAQMDVLIIPFKIIPITEACDPVKFYEYSAMGKPTVATCLPELSRVSNLVFFASTSRELADQIRRAHEMSQDSNFRDTLRDYALQNTWRYRCNELTQALKDFPLVSIIILSYGDPELSKASIHSLFDGGLTYPNLEVLVVDNGSPPDSLDKIRSFASGYPDVEIIENGSNLGFAKGNNVGLTRATGDYVMLLNNDTYVAPGAVHAMVRHLSNNPNIGAIGSLTNNIGNEAKITVKYSDMRQMKKVVRRITLGFRSRFFQVNSLAYFSVMFRRSDLDHFGLLPTDYGLGMFEDDDHCKTIHSKGYVTAVAEDGFVHHHLSASFDTLESSQRKALFENNKMIFEKKWGPWQKHQYRKRRPTKII